MAGITIRVAAGDATYERRVDPDMLTLGFLEDVEAAQASGKWRDLIPVYAGLLDIPVSAARQIKVSDLQAIARALSEATAVPNESGPPSA